MKTFKHHLRFALAVLAAALVVACGPGTGGTGTGPSIGTSAPVTGPVSFTGSTAQSGAVFGGTNTERVASVFGPSVSALKNAVLSLDVQRIDLRNACKSFTFVGDWSIAANGGTQVPGTYSLLRILSDGRSEYTTYVATLNLVFANGNAQSDTVSAVVKDSEQIVLMGPFELQRGSSIGTTATACASASGDTASTGN